MLTAQGLHFNGSLQFKDEQSPGSVTPQGFFVFQTHPRLQMPPDPQDACVTSHTPLRHTVGTTKAVSLATLLRG